MGLWLPQETMRQVAAAKGTGDLPGLWGHGVDGWGTPGNQPWPPWGKSLHKQLSLTALGSLQHQLLSRGLGQEMGSPGIVEMREGRSGGPERAALGSQEDPNSPLVCWKGSRGTVCPSLCPHNAGRLDRQSGGAAGGDSRPGEGR